MVRSTGVPVLMRDEFQVEYDREESFAAADIDVEARRAALETVLRAVFAKERLLEGQFEAISSVLAGRDCAVLLPTGAGKSMIYQLAGLCLPGRTLVVDPLVALIEDQADGLRAHGVDRVLGISANSLARDARGAYFVFVTPERFQRQTFRNDLIAGADVEPVNLAVVDEAHCVSEWGHDFRPAYLNFGKTLRTTCKGRLGVPPLLALTGTASRAVLTDVLFQLGIVDDHENAIVRPASFDRAELSYDVLRCSADDSDATLRRVLAAMPGRFSAVAATFFEPTGDEDTYSGIVFVPTVNGWHGLNDTMRVVTASARAAVPFAGAGTPPKGTDSSEWERRRRESTVAFKQNRAPVIVTTKAFGMGIDKPNIRWTVHYGLPGSIESFYQEVGRSGRDRRQARNVLILSESDRERSRRLLGAGADPPPGRPRRAPGEMMCPPPCTSTTVRFPARRKNSPRCWRCSRPSRPTDASQSAGEVPMRASGQCTGWRYWESWRTTPLRVAGPPRRRSSNGGSRARTTSCRTCWNSWAAASRGGSAQSETLCRGRTTLPARRSRPAAGRSSGSSTTPSSSRVDAACRRCGFSQPRPTATARSGGACSTISPRATSRRSSRSWRGGRGSRSPTG